jgi:hypothetical protein
MDSYLDYSDDYLPGQYYRKALGRSYTPQQLTQLRAARNWRFQSAGEPEDKSELFQRFLAIQDNPEALMPKLPDTPFGNLRSYMGA